MKLPFKKIIVLGSGALKIGEAGEFDYSGTQALKALKEEGIQTVLVNPNIATNQTDAQYANMIYFLPVTPDFVEKIIEHERPDGIMLSFGGQTALNCGLALEERGVLARFNVTVLGNPIGSIRKTEDRALFSKELATLGVSHPKSKAVTRVQEAREAGEYIGYPVFVRAGFALGGQGAGVVDTPDALEEACKKTLARTSQLLVEEYLDGWCEIEYEIMRDAYDNCIAICNMENIDSMGIHTGDSIVTAPSQTLTNAEYHSLRSVALRVVRHLQIVGECNIQFALNPNNPSDYRVIEVNARLSRSSALASKATGYPIAAVAAKLALGYSLPELRNAVTQVTTACFEPALDYVVTKLPRWEFEKFKTTNKRIGAQMQSVGEVMAVGRTFEESLQKGARMLKGNLWNGRYADGKNSTDYLTHPHDKRLYEIIHAFDKGLDVAAVHAKTKINTWFLHKLAGLAASARVLTKEMPLSKETLLRLKQQGFSDNDIGTRTGRTEEEIRKLRSDLNVYPCVKKIDTLAAEFPSQTNYCYMTYNASTDDEREYTDKRKVIIIGSGPYSIGSSVEFDWCCVNATRTLRLLGYYTIVVNCNPETVSTDYDSSDMLYFEELTLERVLDIVHKEQPWGVVVSVGGQVPNGLALALSNNGVRVLGTSAQQIDRAENRKTFSAVLDKLGIAQPAWVEAANMHDIEAFVHRVGFPVLVRPSYVLSGSAMAVAFNQTDLEHYIETATQFNSEHPVVLTQFMNNAKEIEVDAVGYNGTLVAYAVCEHVENAGIHSGDATMVIPAQKVYTKTMHALRSITEAIAKEFLISGPFNIQFLAKQNKVFVIECNIRASRTFPFISKFYNKNFIEMATRACVGLQPDTFEPPETEYVAVKVPQFSFVKIHDADPVTGVNMLSTGEVACFGTHPEEAYLKGLLATGFVVPQKNILLSIGGDENKADFLDSVKILARLGFTLYGTARTAEFYSRHAIPVTPVYKPRDHLAPAVVSLLEDRTIELFINTSDMEFYEHIPDDYIMRRKAIDFNVPLFTNVQTAKILVRALARYHGQKTFGVTPWHAYGLNV